MTKNPTPVIAVNLPMELVAKLADLKQDREDDRDKSIEELVRELCQNYVDVRAMAREEAARKDEIDRSYEEHPDDWDDAELWAKAYPPAEDGQP
jgi:hypothetical protein